ncbi:hypothetical protein AAFF_G00159690 [Aldrovandia affinis]|uniref:Torsin-1A-interacting protein 1/2 AAA+ activator domain-containing protein n=1 Tax=Aldrovandia affinis TaxID=143900 RepID=A0AAD7RND9_9TELE|nr:hypothetical protein AAFF_G00159690 [Aldrovandia affinis]
MDSNTLSMKSSETNVRVTRLSAKKAVRVDGQKETTNKRKRHRENEITTTETNGSKEQTGDAGDDEEERSPNKIRKLTGDRVETNNSEEDMEAKEDEEDKDEDQDQIMSEEEQGVDEEDSCSNDRDEHLKCEPLVLTSLRSRRSIHFNQGKEGEPFVLYRHPRPVLLENRGKEVHLKKNTESLSGRGLCSLKNRAEPFSARTSSTHYTAHKEITVLGKGNSPSWNRYPPSEASVSVVGRQDVRPRVSQANSAPPLQKRSAKGVKQELRPTVMKTKSYSFFEGWFWKLCLLLLILAGVVLHLFMGEQAPRHEREVGEGFRAQFLDVASSFPSQRAELWKRSKIHLERHLQTAQPTEPVSMILTSGRRAERTLRCLASHMAVAFSSALNGSVLHIEGLNSTMLESDQVKLDIDNKLRGAFQSDKRAAVIHRFEELPPGSTLIFYRYCDHENAAFKNVLLVFTVLLPTDELDPQLGFNAVEEMVQDHIQDKFLSSSHSASYNQMDMDKLSGLWSRISHLILPVAAEERIEQQGCGISAAYTRTEE